MQSSMPALAIALPRFPFLFSPLSLSARLLTLTDQRDRRGIRYPLAVLLTIAILAKLAEQDSPRAIADWAQLRAPALTDLFGLDRPTMPHATTWNRVLGGAVDPQQFSRLVADFLATASTPPGGKRRKRRRRGEVALSLDGKENEIVAAKRVLQTIDVRGCVVSGDAMFAQRDLSCQIRCTGGDYLWCIKENHAHVSDAIATLFTTPPLPAAPDDFTTARSVDTAHGRYEERQLTASRLVAGDIDWPHACQVFQIERSTILCGGKVRTDVAYGITRLPPWCADAARLLALARGHWGIENGLFYRRDVTLGEDRSLRRRGNGPQVLATLNDLTVGLLHREGHTNHAAARRLYAAFPDHAFNLLTAP